METGTTKPKPNYTKVLCEPSSAFVDIDRGMTTEDQKVTQVMSSTAEGREDYSYFVIDDVIGQDKIRVGNQTNLNQL